MRSLRFMGPELRVTCSNASWAPFSANTNESPGFERPTLTRSSITICLCMGCLAFTAESRYGLLEQSYVDLACAE